MKCEVSALVPVSTASKAWPVWNTSQRDFGRIEKLWAGVSILFVCAHPSWFIPQAALQYMSAKTSLPGSKKKKNPHSAETLNGYFI